MIFDTRMGESTAISVKSNLKLQINGGFKIPQKWSLFFQIMVNRVPLWVSLPELWKPKGRHYLKSAEKPSEVSRSDEGNQSGRDDTFFWDVETGDAEIECSQVGNGQVGDARIGRPQRVRDALLPESIGGKAEWLDLSCGRIYSIFSTTTLDLFLLKRPPPPRFTQ